MCGAGCHGTAGELRALSDRLKAPLIHSVKGKDIMAYDDPHWMGGIGMIGAKADYHAIMHCDLLLMLGTDYPYSEFLPRKGSVIQVDERARVLGRRAPTTLGVVGSVAPTLKLLLFSRASAGHKRKSLVKIGEVTPPKRPPILGPLELGEPVSSLQAQSKLPALRLDSAASMHRAIVGPS